MGFIIRESSDKRSYMELLTVMRDFGILSDNNFQLHLDEIYREKSSSYIEATRL